MIISSRNLRILLLASMCLTHLTSQAEDETMETIIVTGSYIKGTAEDAASPVLVLNREDLVVSGVSDMSEVIRNLEIASGSDTAPADGARFNGRSGSGLANVALRGLGPTSTLVLMDGKRLPFAGQKLSDGDRFVDINSIPITMIERIEVLKDGGSALYGSDAIAGVVNFITRNNFEGFEISYKGQTTTGEDQEDQTLGAIWGWASDDGDSHLVIGGEYFDRSLLRASERTDIRRDLYARQDFRIVNNSAAFAPIPGVRTVAGDPQCGALGLGFFRDDSNSASPNSCNRHRTETDIFIPDAERTSLMMTGSHIFSETAEVYTQLSNMQTRTGQEAPVHVGPLEPKFFFPSLLGATAGSVPWSTDPFTGGAPGDPSVIANGGPLPAGPIPGVQLPLDLVDTELRVPGIEADREFDVRNETETTRFQVGIRGDLNIVEKGWSYDLSITQGKSQYETSFLGVDKNRLELALYGLGGPDCKPNGSIAADDPRAIGARFFLAGADGKVRSDGSQGVFEPFLYAINGNVDGFPTLNADNLLLAMTSNNQGTGGCHFFNPYLTRAANDPLSGAALTNPEELLRWLEVPINKAHDTETKLTSYDLVFSGELFDIGNRPVSAAFGMQYRKESRKTTVHPQFTGSVNSFGVLAGAETVAGLSENMNFDAERGVAAAFMEFQVPVTATLDLQLAARYEDYGSDVGDTFDPKLALRWQAGNTLVLRGSASSSFRGPSLAQVNEGTGFSLEFGVADVLGERGDALGDMRGTNCVRTGQCTLAEAAVPPSIIIVKQGLASPLLEPEEAVTYNLGLIWTPDSGFLSGLTLGIDYYNIIFEDKIIDVPTQSFLTTELAAFEAALAANDFVIVQPGDDFQQVCDPTAPEFQVGGDAMRPEQCQVNPLSYAFDSIQRRVDLTRDLQIISGPAINTGKVETDGIDLNFAYPFDTGWGSFVVSGALNWINKFEVKKFPVGQPDFDAAGFTNRDPNKRLARSLPDLKGNIALNWLLGDHAINTTVRYVGSYEDNASASQRLEDEFDAYYAVDLRYTYSLRVGDRSVLALSVGAIDALDADLPKVRSFSGVDLTVFDQRGRRVYASISYSL